MGHADDRQHKPCFDLDTNALILPPMELPSSQRIICHKRRNWMYDSNVSFFNVCTLHVKFILPHYEYRNLAGYNFNFLGFDFTSTKINFFVLNVQCLNIRFTFLNVWCRKIPFFNVQILIIIFRFFVNNPLKLNIHSLIYAHIRTHILTHRNYMCKVNFSI